MTLRLIRHPILVFTASLVSPLFRFPRTTIGIVPANQTLSIAAVHRLTEPIGRQHNHGSLAGVAHSIGPEQSSGVLCRNVRRGEKAPWWTSSSK